MRMRSCWLTMIDSNEAAGQKFDTQAGTKSDDSR